MPTRMPQAARCEDSHATSGVLPVPPTVRLPTTTTGTATLMRWRSPRRYSTLRRAMNEPYSSDSGTIQSGPLRLYHIFSIRDLMRSECGACGSSIAELGTLEAGVGAVARDQVCVPATFHD